MKFKMKYLAGALAAMGSAGAFAAPLDPTTDTPDVTFYIAGASAQKAGIQAIAASKYFATPSEVVYITSSLTKDTVNFSNPLNFPQGSIGFFGMSKASFTGGTSKKLLFLFSSANGSAAGINQLILHDASMDEAKVVNVGSSATCVANGTVPASTTGIVLNTYKCAGFTPRVADMALSDVNVDEFPAGVIVGDPSGLSETRATALEGFGIGVNNNLYFALQQQNAHDGLLAASCVAGLSATTYNTTGACQPTLSKAQYADIATASTTSVSAMVPNATLPGSPVLNLYRRVPLSGTQASSGIYFLNTPCGDVISASRSPSGAFSSPGYNVILGSQTDDVLSGMKDTNANNFNLGIISFEKGDSDMGSTDGTVHLGRYVKLNGISGTYPDGVTLDAKRRKTLITGDYDYQVEMAAYVRPGTTLGALATAVISDVSDSGSTDIAGIVYLAGSDTTKLARLARGGANCSPLQ